jgi:hypothetical protein
MYPPGGLHNARQLGIWVENCSLRLGTLAAPDPETFAMRLSFVLVVAPGDDTLWTADGFVVTYWSWCAVGANGR